jgi:AAA+ ATPase superfamily predicted ATPase
MSATARASKGKPAIFFSAHEANDRLNLQLFSEKAYSFFKLPKSTGEFRNWRDAFSFIAEKAEEQRFMLVIDEFPYLASANNGIQSILQNIIDHSLSKTQLFLILCRSQISFMERKVLGAKSPLFGRRTSQIRLEGFDCFDAAEMLPGITNEDKVRYYACIGGTPHYLSQVDRQDLRGKHSRPLFQPARLSFQRAVHAASAGAARARDVQLRDFRHRHRFQQAE